LSGLWARAAWDEMNVFDCLEGVLMALGVRSPKARREGVLEGLCWVAMSVGWCCLRDIYALRWDEWSAIAAARQLQVMQQEWRGQRTCTCAAEKHQQAATSKQGGEGFGCCGGTWSRWEAGAGGGGGARGHDG
jgi:hypothetical protein